MGIAITELLERKEISLDELKDKIILVDSYMMLYQFLTTIRQRDGTQLMDSKGNVTSHLVGILSRISNLMNKGIKLAFVFDGKPSELKKKERDRRKELKIEASKKYEEALGKEDLDAMKKYASRTVRLTKEIIDESKELIKAFGLPVIEAPSEAEAQASYMVSKGDAYAVATNDVDALIFGAPLVVKNLSAAGKRKKTSKLSYEIVKPELISLNETLNKLGIDRDQLIVLGMLVGTDYNVGGIKGTGPKNAIKIVKKYGKDFDNLFKDLKWDDFFDYPWTEVYYLIKKMPKTDYYKLEWGTLNLDKIKKILIEEHDFSEERVIKALDKLIKKDDKKKQKGLGEFFS